VRNVFNPEVPLVPGDIVSGSQFDGSVKGAYLCTESPSGVREWVHLGTGIRYTNFIPDYGRITTAITYPYGGC
jgi:hypothetical protein